MTGCPHRARAATEMVSAPALRVEDDSLVAQLPDGPVRLPVIELPDRLAAWLDEGRREMYGQLLDGSKSVPFFPQHLPVVVSYNAAGVFPFTCGNKGVGNVPKPEHLMPLIRRYRDTIEASKGKPWQESLRARLEAAAEFNLDPERIDRRCLGTLEIFERQTYRNLVETPLASLLFTGYSPRYTSFQLNCAVEVIEAGDPRHTFITLARTMFEYDDFHITQSNFPYAYVFWISECVEKTPFRVQREDAAESGAPEAGLGMPWDREALEAVGRAPRMIQAHIQTVVEKYAGDRGFDRVSLLVVQEARRNLMDGR